MITKEDLKYIETYLKRTGKKTSDLIRASLPLKGNELVTLVQANMSKAITIDNLVAQLRILSLPHLCNLDNTFGINKTDLKSAINNIPSGLRIAGQIVTFTNEDNEWVMYQFTGLPKTLWNILELWIKK